MSGATVTVMYPRKEGATFDLEYYKKTHMPLVSNTWGKYGLKSYAVTQTSPDAPYSTYVTMEFESIEGFGNAIKDEGTKAVMEDVANFSSEQPVLLAGPVVSRG